MKIKIGVSNRHVHLTKEDYEILFGDKEITIKNNLVQTGEFASNSVVNIKTEKNTIENVRVLGPFRNYTQVEISRTDSYKLGINPPIRDSGDLSGSEKVTIIGPKGRIEKECCIIPTRHIHIDHSNREKYNLLDVEYVSVKVGDIKTTILEKVFIKESQNGVLELHLDTDDANSSLLRTGDIAEII